MQIIRGEDEGVALYLKQTFHKVKVYAEYKRS